jgi:FHS family L-fucose permease-like MFS transporter
MISSTANEQRSYRLPVILITSLFFLWGFSYGLLDVLNKHFQEHLHIDKQSSSLLQLAYFGAYFIMALPAGTMMNRYGYKRGVLSGLLLFAIGALLFIPAAKLVSFPFFLFALFVLASGLTFLETAANPFITLLGDERSSAFRLNLAQSFNGVGSFIGPLIGGLFLFSETAVDAALGQLQTVYMVIAGVVLLLAIFIFRTTMPEPGKTSTSVKRNFGELLGNKTFTFAVIAQFFYVAAQVSVAAFFINYCTEFGVTLSNEKAAYLLSVSLLLFTVGRFVGTAILRKIPAARLLMLYAFVAIILCAVVILAAGQLGIIALMGIFFFESIMFPTIFALGIRDTGEQTQLASSIIVMSIVGGALVPLVMGGIADSYGTAISYVVPLCCFFVVGGYSFMANKISK